MGGVIACHAHGRDGEVGEMDGAGLGAWRRVRSPSWGTSLVLGSPVFWLPFVGVFVGAGCDGGVLFRHGRLVAKVGRLLA